RGDPIASIRRIERALIDNGETPIVARNLRRWLVEKALQGVDEVDDKSRARYRAALAALPTVPTGNPGRRRTAVTTSAPVVRAGKRSNGGKMAAVAFAGGLTLAALGGLSAEKASAEALQRPVSVSIVSSADNPRYVT
ncbi:MAG: hypothetical protein JWL83_4672, partial [Actinomycetia bacterium]|nr:hypothetical protein [Actinomycetes bacterium]